MFFFFLWITKKFPLGDCQRPYFNQLNAHILQRQHNSKWSTICALIWSKHGRIQSPLDFFYRYFYFFFRSFYLFVRFLYSICQLVDKPSRPVIWRSWHFYSSLFQAFNSQTTATFANSSLVTSSSAASMALAGVSASVAAAHSLVNSSPGTGSNFRSKLGHCNGTLNSPTSPVALPQLKTLSPVPRATDLLLTGITEPGNNDSSASGIISPKIAKSFRSRISLGLRLERYNRALFKIFSITSKSSWRSYYIWSWRILHWITYISLQIKTSRVYDNSKISYHPYVCNGQIFEGFLFTSNQMFLKTRFQTTY